MSTDVPMRFADCFLLKQIDAAIPTALCEHLVSLIEAGQPEAANPSKDFRDNDRILRDDPALTATLFGHVRPHLPATIGPLRLVGLNERLRLYRYRPGQRFTPHMDHWYQASPRRITLLTLLIYLNEDFTGGETRFMEQLEAVVRPATGAAALFQHKVRHEGCEVLSGQKYALRTEVIYEADSEIRLLYE